MFAIHGSHQTEEDMGTKPQSHVAYCSLVGQVSEFLIPTLFSLPTTQSKAPVIP